MPCRSPCTLLHPSCIHILRWSLKRSVKRTWTGSAYSANKSAWSVRVTGSQSHVRSGPKVGMNGLLKGHFTHEPRAVTFVMVRTLDSHASKGCTMGVGKAVLGSHGTSSKVWRENGPCCWTIAYFVGGKREEDSVSYNMSQTPPIWENYLVVFVSPRIYSKICPEIYPSILNKTLKKHLRQAHLLEVDWRKFRHTMKSYP